MSGLEAYTLKSKDAAKLDKLMTKYMRVLLKGDAGKKTEGGATRRRWGTAARPARSGGG